MSVVDKELVKQAANMPSDTNDTALQATLDAAEAMIARRIGPLTSTEYVEYHTGRRATLTLERFPIVSLTSVADFYGNAVDLSLLHLDPSGVLRYKSQLDAFYQPSYTVTYRAGWGDPLQGDIVQAVIELTRHLWAPRNGRPGANRSGADAVPMPYALPNRVQEYLTPYMPLGS